MDIQELKDIDEEFVLHTYARANVGFVRGENATLYDLNNLDYIDFGSGIGVNSVGHNNNLLVDSITDQAKSILHSSNLYHIQTQSKLAQKLVSLYQRQSLESSDMRVFFSNSGAEANECAIKIARKFGYPNRYKIITLQKSFHGRTIASLKATGQEDMHKYFGPYGDGFVYAKDINDVKNHIDSTTCAVLIELVQGEGGINALPKQQVQNLATLLKEKNILLMIDEVQSGIYRTGKLFASNIYGIQPEVITMAKGLGGGIPIGATMTSLCDIFSTGEHGSTFGGNFLSTRAGLCVLDILDSLYSSNLLNKTIQTFESKLDSLISTYPHILQKRVGLGLMCGVVVQNNDMQKNIIQKALQNRLLVLKSGQNVIRFLPALTISDDEINEGFARLEQTLKEI